MGGGIFQFIKFILDRGSIDQARTDAQKAGEAIGKAAADGTEKFLPHTRAAFSALIEGMKNKVGELRAKIDDMGVGAIRVFDSLKAAGADAFEKAFPFTVALLMERAIRAVAAAAKDLTEELIHSAALGQRISLEFQTTFGELTGQAEVRAAALANLFGKSNLEMKEMLLHVQGLNLGLGMSRQQATDSSLAMVKLAGDIAGFRGVPFERALGAISSAMMGITRTAHQLGIPITKARIELQALTETGKQNKATLTDQEKSLAALHVIMSRTAEMTGFAERNSHTLGIEWGRITAIFKDARDQVGREFIPILQSLAEFVMMNRDEIKSFVTDGLRLLVDGFNIATNTVRIFYDVFDAGAFGAAGAIELLVGGVAQLIGLIPGMNKLFDFTRFGLNATSAGFIDATKGAERLADALKAFQSARGDPNAKHPAGAMPGSDAGSGEETAKDRDKRIQEQYQTAIAAMKIEATREIGRQLALKTEEEISRLLATGNLTLAERVKFSTMSNGLANEAVTLYDKDLQRAIALSKIEGSRVEAATQLLVLGYQYTAMAKGQSLTTEQEELRQVRIHQVRTAIAEINAADVKKAMDRLSLTDDEVTRAGELLAIEGRIRDLRAAAKTDEDRAAVDALEKTAKGQLRGMSPMLEIAGAFDGAITGAQSFSDALTMLRNDANITHKVLMALGKGSGKAMLRELADLAKGKVLENLAYGLEDIGLSLLGHPGAGPGAAFHFKAAAAWGLVAGVAGAAGSAGGGTEAPGGYTPGNTGGSTVEQATTLPPVTNIYIDGVDPNNASHQAIIGDTLQQGWERGVVNIFPGASAPANVRGTA